MIEELARQLTASHDPDIFSARCHDHLPVYRSDVTTDEADVCTRIGEQGRELNTQAGCLYGQGCGRLACGPTTWRSIHS